MKRDLDIDELSFDEISDMNMEDDEDDQTDGGEMSSPRMTRGMYTASRMNPR